jgi:hypothetical protein
MLFFAPNVATLAVAAAALSTAGMMVGPASFAILTDTVEAGRRQAAFALSGWAVNIGTAIAGVLGGYLAAHGYWLLFVLDAGGSLLYAGIVVWLLPSDRAERVASATAAAAMATAAVSAGSSPIAVATPASSGYAVVFRDRLMRRLLPLFTVQLFIYSLTESALPLAIRTDGLSRTVLGMAAALNAGIVVALQPLATSVLGRFPRTAVYAGLGNPRDGRRRPHRARAQPGRLRGDGGGVVAGRGRLRRRRRRDDRRPRPGRRPGPVSGGFQLGLGRGPLPGADGGSDGLHRRRTRGAVDLRRGSGGRGDGGGGGSRAVGGPADRCRSVEPLGRERSPAGDPVGLLFLSASAGRCATKPSATCD